MANGKPVAFRDSFKQLVSDMAAYFDKAQLHIEERFGGVFADFLRDPDAYWNELSEELKAESDALVRRLLVWAGEFSTALRKAALASESDQRGLGLAVKAIRSALVLRKFRHSDPDYLHDEDRVFGVTPATQSDNEALRPAFAKDHVAQSGREIVGYIQLVEASGELSGEVIEERSKMQATRYRPGTAFIMMWMDKNRPELEDVSVAVKEVFAEFDIRAVRADDIEHEGLITQRILNEIATSEFLFADLSGERPNVYYEVGYAHALGKRVHLFRKGQTNLHFDLAGHNCPSYENNKDLKEKLRKRLVALTNREPKKVEQ